MACLSLAKDRAKSSAEARALAMITTSLVDGKSAMNRRARASRSAAEADWKPESIESSLVLRFHVRKTFIKLAGKGMAIQPFQNEHFQIPAMALPKSTLK